MRSTTSSLLLGLMLSLPTTSAFAGDFFQGALDAFTHLAQQQATSHLMSSEAFQRKLHDCAGSGPYSASCREVMQAFEETSYAARFADPAEVGLQRSFDECTTSHLNMTRFFNPQGDYKMHFKVPEGEDHTQAWEDFLRLQMQFENNVARFAFWENKFRFSQKAKDDSPLAKKIIRMSGQYVIKPGQEGYWVPEKVRLASTWNLFKGRELPPTPENHSNGSGREF